MSSDKLQADAWISRLDGLIERQGYQSSDGGRQADRHHPADGQAIRRYGGPQACDLSEHAKRLAEQSFAFGRRAYAACSSDQKRSTEFGFQVLDVMRQRRLSNVQRPRCCRHTARLDDRHEISQLAQLDVHLYGVPITFVYGMDNILYWT